jgi:hypothetical protein
MLKVCLDSVDKSLLHLTSFCSDECSSMVKAHALLVEEKAKLADALLAQPAVEGQSSFR